MHRNIRLTDSYRLQRDATDRQVLIISLNQSVIGEREAKEAGCRYKKMKKLRLRPFGISFSPARLHLASPVIGARVSEALVSRQQTICEYRPAKP